MTPDKIFVFIFSLTGIIFTYWFFLGKKEEKVSEAKNNNVEIVVEGGYSPNVISIPQGRTTVLTLMVRGE